MKFGPIDWLLVCAIAVAFAAIITQFNTGITP